MNITVILTAWTIVVLVLFVGIVIWAYDSRRKARFEDDARIPFNDDDTVAAPNNSKENSNA
jgi:cytochrome c oxidase cbb3-type subunit 4